MMMRMLEAGGLPPLTDGLRHADEDNPLGYYEDERVRRLDADATWLPEARGRALKVISFLLPSLPRTERYRVLFMRRDLGDVLASQERMMRRRGEDPTGSPDLRPVFTRHQADVAAHIATRPEFETLWVDYDDTLRDPLGTSRRVSEFLGGGLDIAAMAATVDGRLCHGARG